MDNRKTAYYENENFTLINGDCFEEMKKIPKKSIDMIFADPPYFLSSGGISCRNGKQVSVNKGEWDYSKTIDDKIAYHQQWILLCKDILKDDGSIWISSTFHSVYAIGVALEKAGFSIINNIIWRKTNPAPNISCRAFTHSTETVIWARKIINGNKKGKHYFNYNLMKELNNNKQIKDVWDFEEEVNFFTSSTTPKKEKLFGYHPTQKPTKLLEIIILASTKLGDTILDPFNGSGTTGVVAAKLGRKYVGIEINEEYLKISKLRYLGEKKMREFNTWLKNFRESIANYTYYVDFDKAYIGVEKIKIQLNILNSLIGSRNIKEDFCNLIKKYPDVL